MMTTYKVIRSKRAEKDLLKIKKSGDKSSYKRVERMFEELKYHPYTGIGKPEPLKHGISNLWSRKINKKDRLVYEVEDNIVTVTVISAYGHYDDK